MQGVQHFRQTWAEIDLDAIRSNIQHVQQHIGKKEIIAVVKADGYGHGAVEVAKVAEECGVQSLAVAFLDEAIYLRSHGIKLPVLVLGYVAPQYANIAQEQDITLTVFQEEWIVEAASLLKKMKPLTMHIKMDTGMGRLGVCKKEEVLKLIQMIQNTPSMKVEGLYTHFSTADEKDITYYQQQLQKFNETIQYLKEHDQALPIIHSENSAAGIRFVEENFDRIRLGIAMYGLLPSLEIEDEMPFPLKQAFSLHSCITHIKKIEIGAGVSYGATYRAEREEWIATIPIGYADGWLRALKNRHVLVNGKRYPIVGRVCMDQCMVALSEFVSVGTKVTLIGKQGSEYISVDEVATDLQTINYEVTCLMNHRVPRVYVRDGVKTNVKNPLLQS